MNKKIIVILIGLIFMGIGIYTLVSGNAKAKRCTEETSGVVVEVVEERKTDSDGKTTYSYYPVIEYRVGEESITKKHNIGSGNSSKYIEGDEIDILYDPNSIEDFIIKGDNSLKMIGYIFAGFGLFTTVVGVVSKRIS